MAEQLLDGAQVGSAVEQVRGERVPQPVRVGDDPAQGARVEAAPAHGQEECVVCSLRQVRPRLAQVAAEPKRRLLAERHDALLAALAAPDSQELLLEVDVSEIEAYGLRAPQSGGIDELDESAVPQRDRPLALERLERALDVCGGGGVWQAPRAARAEARVGDALGPERMPEEGAHRGQLAADRGRRELPAASRAAEPGDVVGEHADVDRGEVGAVILEPGAELSDVAAVGAPSRLAQRGRGEEAIGCSACVHEGTVRRASLHSLALASFP